MAIPDKPDKDVAVQWGPCCFCGQPIESNDVDPCSVQVSTVEEKWQVWFCHAACFRERIVSTGEMDLSPAHF